MLASSVAGAWEGVGWVGRGQVFGKKRLFEEFLCLKRQAQVTGEKRAGSR